jgi:hypothetical protein
MSAKSPHEFDEQPKPHPGLIPTVKNHIDGISNVNQKLNNVLRADTVNRNLNNGLGISADERMHIEQQRAINNMRIDAGIKFLTGK